MKFGTSLVLTSFLFSLSLAVGTTGKIAGTVKDAKTGEKLIGVNVLIDGTSQGASTNVDGFYAIIGVPPGTYKLKASYVGYSPLTVSDVVVNIDQTTNVDFQLTEAAISAQEVIVVATRPVVQKDVSASQTNLVARQFENLPSVQTVSSIMGLQAGIKINAVTGDLVIRGGGGDQTAFMLDGNTLRDERTNKSFLGISLTSIDHIQIQTGGFNAEYGNIRSGIVNAVSREPSQTKYYAGFVGRQSVPAQKHFGDSPNSLNSYWIRPYLDPDVAWTGTKNGKWDEFTQRQYPEFEGWNSVSAKTLADNDPSNDLTPAAAQKIFMWQHRKQLDITKPDYDFDGSFGGPIPFGEGLGNLRFYASYRTQRTMYLVPLSSDSYQEFSGQFKLVSDVGPGMKLLVEGLTGRSTGTNNNNAGRAGVFTSPESIADQLNRVSYIDARIFANDYWAPTTIKRNMVAAKFTHLLSPETFYEVSLQRFSTSYSTNPGRARDTSRIYLFGNSVYLDEAPFGFQPLPSTGIDGLRMGVGFSNSRDTSAITTFTGRVDLSSQLDRYNQVKVGVEYIYNDNNINYASIDTYLPAGRSRSFWRTYPVRASAYLQDKLEFEGMIVNAGLRLDYSNPGGEWYVYNPFDIIFVGDASLGIDAQLPKQPVKKNLTLSPRLGVSFPITENSKLYFNYGHFRSMPTPENLYLIRRDSYSNDVLFLANPNNPLPKTVAYELGYDQSLLDLFLLHLAGYYKDVAYQQTTVLYTSDQGVNYSLSTSDSYEDIRGFEVSLTKARGDWVGGFVNYTYQVSSSGRFGFAQIAAKLSAQRLYEQNPLNIQNDLYQSKPVPLPYGRANIEFFTPPDFGPRVGSLGFLSDWRVSFLGSYSAGPYFTWAGGGSSAVAGLQNNVEWTDFYNVDLRVSKSFAFSGIDIQFFMDVTNLLNRKYFDPGGYGFKDGNDFDDYMKSLHLSSEIGDRLSQTYVNIPGSDRPGDYRKAGVTPVPMRGVESTSSVATPSSTYLYYIRSTGQYMKYVNSQWVVEDPSRVQQVLDDKAYIDMPNLDYFTFLNPRQIFFGVKLSFGL